MSSRRNILIFHLGALGDFVLTWPIALALTRLHPQSRVFYVTHGQKGALAEKALRIESADVENGWHLLHSDPAALPPASARLLAGAHTVVAFQNEPSDAWLGNVRKIAPEATVWPLASKPPDEFKEHLSEFFLSQFEAWPAGGEAIRQILRSISSRGLGLHKPTAGVVAIHPGAGSPRKCWPVDRFVELTRKLKQAGFKPRVILGDVERERWSAATVGELESVADVRWPATLRDLFNELSSAAVFVGNDSGPGHLAAMLGVPTVSIFGDATDPNRWKPLGPRTAVVQGQAINAISVEMVLAEVKKAASLL